MFEVDYHIEDPHNTMRPHSALGNQVPTVLYRTPGKPRRTARANEITVEVDPDRLHPIAADLQCPTP